MFVIGDVIKGIFGDKGLTGGVLEVLKDTGVLKSPEDIAKAEQAIRDFEISKGNQNLETLKTELADIASARDMQKEALRQDDKFAKRFIYYLAVLVIGMVFLFDLLMFFVDYPLANRDMINQVSGILNATALVMVLSFFFGTSHGSQEKNAIIAGLEKRR